MANVTKAQLLDLVAQLERNAEDDRRRIGVMMYEANQLTQRVVELEAEVESLDDELTADKELADEAADDSDKLYDAQQVIKVQAERIKLLSRKVAAQPKTAPRNPKPAPKPLPVSAVESQPTVEITDADKRIWSAFKALPREKRQFYYEFARASVGHLGIHNIAAVREAYLAKQAA